MTPFLALNYVCSLQSCSQQQFVVDQSVVCIALRVLGWCANIGVPNAETLSRAQYSRATPSPIQPDGLGSQEQDVETLFSIHSAKNRVVAPDWRLHDLSLRHTKKTQLNLSSTSK